MRGFTTLELLMVAGVTALVWALSFPILSSVLNQARLRSEARILKDTIEELAITAQLRGSRITLEVNRNGFRGFRESETTEPFLTRSFAHQVFGKSEASILLSPSGAMTPTSLELALNSSTCTITVSLRGRANLVC